MRAKDFLKTNDASDSKESFTQNQWETIHKWMEEYYKNKKQELLDDYTTFLFAEGYLTTLDVEEIIEGKAIENFLNK